ncbi:uncharacterized protein LOC135930577 [Gordionus sp. m RMFG-2023]|uniref:uncharacterized protein LOC135930577 n=1 Tax=Gordionus sp. m RMFG-2023 TaxID=3053472 RepID=UPI0031FD08D6
MYLSKTQNKNATDKPNLKVLTKVKNPNIKAYLSDGQTVLPLNFQQRFRDERSENENLEDLNKLPTRTTAYGRQSIYFNQSPFNLCGTARCSILNNNASSLSNVVPKNFTNGKKETACPRSSSIFDATIKFQDNSIKHPESIIGSKSFRSSNKEASNPFPLQNNLIANTHSTSSASSIYPLMVNNLIYPICQNKKPFFNLEIKTVDQNTIIPYQSYDGTSADLTLINEKSDIKYPSILKKTSKIAYNFDTSSSFLKGEMDTLYCSNSCSNSNFSLKCNNSYKERRNLLATSTDISDSTIFNYDPSEHSKVKDKKLKKVVKWLDLDQLEKVPNNSTPYTSHKNHNIHSTIFLDPPDGSSFNHVNRCITSIGLKSFDSKFNDCSTPYKDENKLCNSSTPKFGGINNLHSVNTISQTPKLQSGYFREKYWDTIKQDSIGLSQLITELEITRSSPTKILLNAQKKEINKPLPRLAPITFLPSHTFIAATNKQNANYHLDVCEGNDAYKDIPRKSPVSPFKFKTEFSEQHIKKTDDNHANEFNRTDSFYPSNQNSFKSLLELENYNYHSNLNSSILWAFDPLLQN